MLDLACTKGMTSRFSVNKLIKAIDAGLCPGMSYELKETFSVFGFANGASTILKEKIFLWFEQGPNMPYLMTSFDICEQGKTPFLLALNQMMNLYFWVKCAPTHIELSSAPLGIKDLVLPMTTTRHVAMDFKLFCHRGAELGKTKAFPVEKPQSGSHVFAGGPNPVVPSTGPPSAGPSSSSAGPSADVSVSGDEDLGKFTRVDKRMHKFVTTCTDGPSWPTVIRRVVTDLQTGEEISDIRTEGVSDKDLYGDIPNGPRDIKTVL